MTTSCLIEILGEPCATKPWQFDQVVRAVDDCAILTAEIAIPFGESLTQSIVEAWVFENLPAFAERYGTRLRWHTLLSRNTPEGSRVRILLVVSPRDFSVLGNEPDIALPTEFAILGAAEAEASKVGGNFVWVSQHKSVIHWLVYREGLIAFWSVDKIPAELPQDWLTQRIQGLQSFLDNDTAYPKAESWNWISTCGALPLVHAELRKFTWSATDVKQALASVVAWNWFKALSILERNESERMKARREIRRVVRNATVALLVVAVVCAGLLVHQKNERDEYREISSNASALLAKKNDEQATLASLEKVTASLDAEGVVAQRHLGVQLWMSQVFNSLPDNGHIEQLHLESHAPDGFSWNVQAVLPGWDAADLFVAKVKALNGVVSVAVESRKVTANGQIMVRMEVRR